MFCGRLLLLLAGPRWLSPAPSALLLLLAAVVAVGVGFVNFYGERFACNRFPFYSAGRRTDGGRALFVGAHKDCESVTLGVGDPAIDVLLVAAVSLTRAADNGQVLYCRQIEVVGLCVDIKGDLESLAGRDVLAAADIHNGILRRGYAWKQDGQEC